MAAVLEDAAAYKEHMAAYRAAAETFSALAEAPRKVYRELELRDVCPPYFYLYDTQSERGVTSEITPPADQIPAWYRQVLALRKELFPALSALTFVGERR
jgi:stress response protein YsnF